MTEFSDRIAHFLDRAAGDKMLLEDRPYADGGTSMLFPRLQRAATNQLNDGPSTISRYGIWAMTGRDKLSEALKLLEAGETVEGRLLIVQVASALTAFAAVQKALAEAA